MKKRYIKYILIIFIVIIVISFSWFKKNKYIKNNDIINVALGSEPDSLDPAKSLTIDNRSYLSNLFEGLVNINSKGEVIEGMAEKWETNESNTEFTFYIRENAMWSDGTKVTASDFKFAWLRVLNPDTASGWASYLYYIKGAEEYNSGIGTEEDVEIKTEGSNILRVKLKNPCAFFINMTALQPYYPVSEKIVSKNENWASNNEKYVSNGAYKLKKWNHNENILITKNDFYWDKKNINIKNVSYELLSDSKTIINSYELGDLDFVSNVATYDEMKQISKVKKSNFVYTKFLALNSDVEVLKNKNVRKAISIALDRKNISNLMGENTRPLTSIIPYGFYNISEEKDYTDDSNSKNFLKETSEIEKAKQLIEKSGYKNIKLTYLTNNSSANTNLAEIIKEQLFKIGIEINIQILEKKVFGEYRKQRQFDVVAASWAAEYPDISSYLYGFRKNDLNNYSGFSDSEFDILYDKIIKETNIDKKFKYVHEAETKVMNSYLIIPLYSENLFYISNGDLKGYYYDITGCLVMKYAYLK